MAEYIDKNELIRFLNNLKQPRHPITEGFTFISIDDAIKVVIEKPTADVVEREKIDKAIEVITRLRDSCERMITEDVSVANECYEQYVNCYDECLRIIKQNIGESE